MVMTREQINELCERQEKSGPSIATEFGQHLEICWINDRKDRIIAILVHGRAQLASR
jgi:hypothetical protein